MDPIALNVPDDVFAATHFPSFLQREGARRGAFVPWSEEEFLEDFLSPDLPHVFDVAVGDSGAGKSHLIRWMYQEACRRTASSSSAKIVLIPRSSSNLADVVRRIIQGFDGEIARRLTEDLDRQQVLSPLEAKNRVLDELCHVLEDPGREVLKGSTGIDGIEAEILSGLPALLRSPRLRQLMVEQRNGVVSRVAEHVMGSRQALPGEGELRWTGEDLRFTPRECEAADHAARETAILLAEDDACCELAVRLINRAQPTAVRRLLRFRTGDMKAVLAEIRAALRIEGRELFLFIEDLSITEGVDAELVEALQVRTRDTGTDLCRLRSIVGVTTDDYARMRENIAEGRVHRTVFFNMPVGGAATHSVTQDRVAEFAARYLNAVRLTEQQLKDWYDGLEDGAPPNVCERCSVRSDCHAGFGSVGGTGLYPFTRTSLRRLYTQVAQTRGQAEKPFNPRLLVGRVLNELLEQAESGLAGGGFPTRTVAESFALTGVPVDVQVNLNRHYPADAERLIRAVDLYSDDPSSTTPGINPHVLAAFGLPQVKTLLRGDLDSEPPRPMPQEVKPGTDEFNRWANEGRLSDSDLNKWRAAIYSAVVGWIDWDVTGLACVKAHFKQAGIQIEGQSTRVRQGWKLEIRRDAETALAIRLLVTGSWGTGDHDAAVILVRGRVSSWSNEVIAELERIRDPIGDPYLRGAELLAIGALLRGSITPGASDADLVTAALLAWDSTEEPKKGRSPAWSALLSTFRRRAPDVRKLLIERFGCTKGAQVGSMLDPSPFLPGLRSALASGEMRGSPESADDWPHHRPIAQLASEVAGQLTAAVDAELAECRGQLLRVSEHLAGNPLKDVLQEAKRSIQVAASAGCLRTVRVANLEARLASMQTKPITACVQEAQKAVDTQAMATRLASLGRTDRALLGECVELLDDVKTVLAASRASIVAERGDWEDLSVAKTELVGLVARVRRGLDALRGD